MSRIDNKGLQRQTAFQSKIQNPKSKMERHPTPYPRYPFLTNSNA